VVLGGVGRARCSTRARSRFTGSGAASRGARGRGRARCSTRWSRGGWRCHGEWGKGAAALEALKGRELGFPGRATIHPRRPCPGRDTRRKSRVRTPRGEGEGAWGARARGCVAAAAARRLGARGAPRVGGTGGAALGLAGRLGCWAARGCSPEGRPGWAEGRSGPRAWVGPGQGRGGEWAAGNPVGPCLRCAGKERREVGRRCCPRYWAREGGTLGGLDGHARGGERREKK